MTLSFTSVVNAFEKDLNIDCYLLKIINKISFFLNLLVLGGFRFARAVCVCVCVG